MPDPQPISAESVLNRFTLVWHTEKPHERAWIGRLFRPYIRQAVVETRHSDVSQAGECGEFLGESMFAPSPVGNTNLECYSVYNALECGAIPIVERRSTLDYFRNLLGPHPLPAVKNWGDARKLIAKFLKAPHSIAVLQNECSSWWAAYQQKYSADIGPFVLSRWADDSTADRPMYEPVANTTWWQLRELIRLHDVPALRRRAQRQASRLLSGHGLRVAFRRGTPER